MTRTTKEQRLEYIRVYALLPGAAVTWFGQPSGPERIDAAVDAITPAGMVYITGALHGRTRRLVDPTSLRPRMRKEVL